MPKLYSTLTILLLLLLLLLQATATPAGKASKEELKRSWGKQVEAKTQDMAELAAGGKATLDECLNEFENFLTELDEPAEKKAKEEEKTANVYNNSKYYEKSRRGRSKSRSKSRGRSRSRSRGRRSRSRSRSRGRRSRSKSKRRSSYGSRRSRSGGRRRSRSRSGGKRRSSGYNPERRDPDRYYD